MTPSRLRGALSHDLLRRSGLFGVSVVASTVVGLFSIPLLTGALGKEGWGELATLQAIGQFASIVVAFGWGATGPATVAALPVREHRQFLWDSLFVRVPLLVLVTPVAILLGIVIGMDPLAAVLATFAYALPGIGAAWYFVGTNRPMRLLLFDAVPAILGQIAGLIAVIVHPDIRSYLWAMLVFTAIGVSVGLIVSLRTRDGVRLHRPVPATLRAEMKTQSHGLVSLLAGNLATMLPLVLLQAFASKSDAATFALIDRLFRYGIIVLSPILQAVQSWVGEVPEMLRRRARGVVWISLGIGLAGGVAYGVLAPLLSGPLTQGEIPLSWMLGGIGAVAFGAECVAQLIGLAGLVAVGRTSVLSTTAVGSSIATVLLLIPATTAFGVTGALVVVAVPIVAMAVIRVVVLWRASEETAETLG